MNCIIRKQIGSGGQVVDTMTLIGFDHTGTPSFVANPRIKPMRFSNPDWEKTIFEALFFGGFIIYGLFQFLNRFSVPDEISQPL